MDQQVRNKLRNVVTQCRKLLEESIAQQLEGVFGIRAGKKNVVRIEDQTRMSHLSDEDQQYRADLLDHFQHIQARGFKAKDALDQLIREIAFTHLNRLCAYKMMEARDVYVGGQKFREAVSRGTGSNGFKFYLADHPEDERLFNTGQQDIAYRHFLDWLGGLLSEEIGVLFHPNDPANRLYPRQKTLDDLLALLNDQELAGIWEQDETIGWVYQYFTPKELRERARKESQAPRNSYELAFRNQFFTPRYVVEFLTDNTLGRIWYEMRKGDTKLTDQCRYMVRRPNEIFLEEGQEPPTSLPSPSGRGAGGEGSHDDLSQDELLKLPVHIPHRPKKDPRELKILDPACGSGHFLLYCFDLLLTIYEEAYSDPDLGPALQRDYASLDDLRRDVPRLIIADNLHGIDIDLRCTQIAALALWLRCQRAYREMGLKKGRPKITRSNLVCAEPMPGEEGLLEEFLGTLHEDRLPKLIRRVMTVSEDTPVRATPEMADRLAELVRLVWDRMKLAGEAGSLLKIEDDLQEAIHKGQEEWEEEQPLFRVTQYALTEQPKETYLRFVPGEGVSFWERAESLVMAALDEFAEYAANGQKLLRNLFVDDAMRGFAFVDLCRQRFDVVLMNPPFGDLITSLRKDMKRLYPDAFNDIFCAFVEHGCSLLSATGQLGAITPRSVFFLSQMSRFRHAVLLTRGRPHLVADLGENVLDEAMNEVACYTISPKSLTMQNSMFIRCVGSHDKARSLQLGCRSVAYPKASDFVFVRSLAEFSVLPGSPFAYWASSQILSKLANCPAFEPQCGIVRQGIATTDDFKFVRLAVEVPPHLLLSPPSFPYFKGMSPLTLRDHIIACSKAGGRWAFHVKSEACQPWYSPLLCVTDWKDNGEAMKSQRMERRQHAAPSEEKYFLPGLSWTRRSVRLVPYVVPAGAIPSASRYEAFPVAGAEHASLAVLASNVASAFARFYGEKFVWPNFLVDNVRNLPFPAAIDSLPDDVVKATEQEVSARRDAYRNFEPFQEFTVPWLIHSFAEAHTVDFSRNRLMSAQHELAICSALGLDESETFLVAADLQEAISYQRIFTRSHQQENAEPGEEGDGVGALDYGARSLHDSLMSYCIGVIVGRWDIRIALDPSLTRSLGPAFAPLPACPPGMLVGFDGLPARSDRNISSEAWIRSRSDCLTLPHTQIATEAETENKKYPLRIDWDGILVHDPDHEDDVVRRVRDVLEVLWKDQPEVIETEACEILGVKSLRDYFRKPGKGGFWDDHVKRYSKSRRKAPIYWLLQSSKKNYAIWLYYHRLDKDMLFKALLNYVEPKIQREENRLGELRSQKSSSAVGSDAASKKRGGTSAKKLDREIERQEDLLSELRDFADKLRRVAELRLEPDLNDGVVLNIAPLYELVPWKEAKKYWHELLDGKYEWSSIGKQLRQKGLVPC